MGKIKAFFSHHIVAAIITALIVGSTTYFWNTYTAFREKFLKIYEDLESGVETMILMDENSHDFCFDTRNDTDKHERFYRKVVMFSYRQNILNQLERIKKTREKLGKFLSYETYYQTVLLISWNGLVLSSKKGICAPGILIEPNVIDIWKNKLLSQIRSERRRYESRIYSLKAYIVYLSTTKAYELYSPPHPDFSKVPIKINVKNY